MKVETKLRLYQRLTRAILAYTLWAAALAFARGDLVTTAIGIIGTVATVRSYMVRRANDAALNHYLELLSELHSGQITREQFRHRIRRMRQE